MNVDKWISDIIASRERCTVPIMTHPGIEMIGATVKDAVQSGEKHAQAINELSKKYPSKAATVIMDLTVEAEAFGCSIAFPENDMPHILGSLVDSESIEGLQIPSLSAGRVPEYILANKMAAEMITDKTGFCRSYRSFLFGRKIIRYVGDHGRLLSGAGCYCFTAR